MCEKNADVMNRTGTIVHVSLVSRIMRTPLGCLKVTSEGRGCCKHLDLYMEDESSKTTNGIFTGIKGPGAMLKAKFL